LRGRWEARKGGTGREEEAFRGAVRRSTWGAANPKRAEGRALRGKSPEGVTSRLLDGLKPLERRYEAREGFVGERRSGTGRGNLFRVIQRREALKGEKPRSVGS
jgi:hypothetical protein